VTQQGGNVQFYGLTTRATVEVVFQIRSQIWYGSTKLTIVKLKIQHGSFLYLYPHHNWIIHQSRLVELQAVIESD
jgi:hypothetical protein